MAEIELVIKIPEEIMEYVKNNGCLSVIYNDEVADAIANGTPLLQSNEDYYEIIVPKGIWNAKYKIDLLFEPRAESDGSEDKKDCKTCIGLENTDYERWFCHDCIKGIQNHYKAESEEV